MANLKQGALAAALAASTFGLPASADEQDRFRTELSGFNEVHFSGGNPATTPPTPASLVGAISTSARGRFRAEIDERTQAIDYVLSYEGLEGAVAQAHIHFGQKHTVGAIVVWLCQGTVRAPAQVAALTPECPQSGTVTGSIRPGMVLAAGQGFESTDDLFRELVRAIRAGATYANVHSSKFPPGEVRGQLEGRGHDHD
jgi:hypothetical protein